MLAGLTHSQRGQPTLGLWSFAVPTSFWKWKPDLTWCRFKNIPEQFQQCRGLLWSTLGLVMQTVAYSLFKAWKTSKLRVVFKVPRYLVSCQPHTRNPWNTFHQGVPYRLELVQHPLDLWDTLPGTGMKRQNPTKNEDQPKSLRESSCMFGESWSKWLLRLSGYCRNVMKYMKLHKVRKRTIGLQKRSHIFPTLYAQKVGGALG